MPGPSFANKKHHGVGLDARVHWVLTPVNFDARLIATLRPLSADASALYIEGQQLSVVLRDELASLTEWSGTAIPPGTGWPDDWYFSYRLRSPAEALDIVAKHLEVQKPSVVDRAWLFDDEAPRWEWQRDRSELRLGGDLAAGRLSRIALALERTPVRRDPAA